MAARAKPHPKPHATGKTKPGDTSERVGVVEAADAGGAIRDCIKTFGVGDSQLRSPHGAQRNAGASPRISLRSIRATLAGCEEKSATHGKHSDF